MTMPIHFVLVRHGESEGNLVKDLMCDGRGHLVPDSFYERHSSTYRLTSRGVEQAKAAGEWLRGEQVLMPFHRASCSEYLRAMETAGHLGLCKIEWRKDFRLRERDREHVGNDAAELRANWLDRDFMDPFYSAPKGGGESIANLCMRLRLPLETLHEGHSDSRVVWVCHGEVMWAMRRMMERLTQREWETLYRSRRSHDKMHNCQIIHYTREDPESGRLAPFLGWMRSVCPWDTSLSSNEWQPIARRTFTNQDLLDEVHRTPRMVDNDMMGPERAADAAENGPEDGS